MVPLSPTIQSCEGLRRLKTIGALSRWFAAASARRRPSNAGLCQRPLRSTAASHSRRWKSVPLLFHFFAVASAHRRPSNAGCRHRRPRPKLAQRYVPTIHAGDNRLNRSSPAAAARISNNRPPKTRQRTSNKLGSPSWPACIQQNFSISLPPTKNVQHRRFGGESSLVNDISRQS
jgi:hypothetical protein